MSVELSPDLLALLTDLKATFHDLQTEVAAVRDELRAKPASPPEPRAWCSVEEVAGMLGKRPYTVREWCRHGQVNAGKRAERRGAAALWSISASEVALLKNKSSCRPTRVLTPHESVLDGLGSSGVRSPTAAREYPQFVRPPPSSVRYGCLWRCPAIRWA